MSNREKLRDWRTKVPMQVGCQRHRVIQHLRAIGKLRRRTGPIFTDVGGRVQGLQPMHERETLGHVLAVDRKLHLDRVNHAQPVRQRDLPGQATLQQCTLVAPAYLGAAQVDGATPFLKHAAWLVEGRFLTDGLDNQPQFLNRSHFIRAQDGVGVQRPITTESTGQARGRALGKRCRGGQGSPFRC